MRKIKINLARSSGFCFGVRRAIHIALNTARTKKRIYMLGDIVHNEEVVRQIQKAGFKKIKRLTNGRNKVLLIRAHGAPLRVFIEARLRGYKIIDATCPMVKEIHRIARDMKKKGYRVLIIGDKRHDEVQGIIGQLKHKALILEDANNLPYAEIKKIKKGCVVVQSTQDLEKVLKIVRLLKSYIPGLKFFNTICKPTRIKQDEIRRMPIENDLMLILGSKNSANTRRLYEISKSLNPCTFWIQSKGQIKTGWLKDADTVGIAAGASTPDSTTQDVINYIKSASLP